MSEVFGAYRIVATLGEGAVSTIYEAVQEPLGRVVAVKALKAQIAPTSAFGEQIEREAKVLAELAHPNVVLVLEQSRGSSGRPYLVLERVDGPSLKDLLAKKRRLPLGAALAVALGVCSALEHAHDRGVVHRDVKPGNILVARTGDVKLIDFGIAQHTRGASTARDAFAVEGVTPSGRLAEPTGDAFGTPAYMSPEQILGDFVDGRSDLFSLGVVLYEMLSGTRPWEPPDATDADRRAAASRMRREGPAPLRDRAPDVPRGVERLVMRLLERAPSERYASAAVVRERLEAALRAVTRDPPASVIRAALAEAGLLPGRGRASATALDAAAPPLSLGKVAFGYAVVLTLFVVAAMAVGRSAGGSTRPAGAAGAGGVSPRSAAEPGEAPSVGGLRVVASPWAHVKVDGADVETTPFARPIPLAPGRHWVTLAHPDSMSVERAVDVAAGETVMLDVTMPIGVDGGKEGP